MAIPHFVTTHISAAVAVPFVFAERDQAVDPKLYAGNLRRACKLLGPWLGRGSWPSVERRPLASGTVKLTTRLLSLDWRRNLLRYGPGERVGRPPEVTLAITPGRNRCTGDSHV